MLDKNFPPRFKSVMDEIRAQAESATTPTEKNSILQKAGLKGDSIYKDLMFDEWNQIPHDIFHLWVMGLTKKTLSVFSASLTDGALKELNWLLAHAKPEWWSSRLLSF